MLYIFFIWKFPLWIFLLHLLIVSQIQYYLIDSVIYILDLVQRKSRVWTWRFGHSVRNKLVWAVLWARTVQNVIGVDSGSLVGWPLIWQMHALYPFVCNALMLPCTCPMSSKLQSFCSLVANICMYVCIIIILYYYYHSILNFQTNSNLYLDVDVHCITYSFCFFLSHDEATV